jgi:hypothetical protein
MFIPKYKLTDNSETAILLLDLLGEKQSPEQFHAQLLVYGGISVNFFIGGIEITMEDLSILINRFEQAARDDGYRAALDDVSGKVHEALDRAYDVIERRK